ncbi:MAG: sigma-70 family RNA polymerase sigma factor [Verrucomicrobia bacterium]|nr:sigma-70 family RNA polymerase sigma factor [Verrucomicrobiota bacterium]
MITVQEESNAFLPTRSSLLVRLKEWDDAASWDEFFKSYNRSILGLGLKRGLTRSEAEEVVQETMFAVARQMPDFNYNRAVGSFKSWLFTITRRAIGKQLTKRLSTPTSSPEAGSDSMESLSSYADPTPGLEEQWDQEWRQNIVQIAMDRVRRKVKPKQFQMFDLYVTQHLPMDQVTRMLNVSSAQVYMAKLRISPMIRHEVSALEKKLI